MRHRILRSIALAGTLIATGTLSGCDGTAPQGPPTYYILRGTPKPDAVFNTIAQTYAFPNNRTNSIWYGPRNSIVTGAFDADGYWAFRPRTTTFASAPDRGTDIHARIVYVPTTNTVIYTRSPAADGVGLGTMDQIAVATIDRATGLLSAGEPAVFPGNFSGSCQLMSSSTTKFYCYDGTRIRVCTTSAGSPRFVCTGAYTLSPPLPPAAECNPTEPCYGGTFAFDGAYFYFAADQGNDQSRDYVVYDATGTLVNTFTATGTGAINGVYFDWSAGRYSTHDGFGNRTGALVFGEAGSDTHNFSPVAETHLLWAP